MFDFEIPKIQKDNCFNAIRLFCCLIVIYEHAILLSNSTMNLFLGGFRNLAVDVFFILSGFWITISLFRSKSLKDYFIKRIKKIFPMYLIVVFGCSVVFYFFSNLSLSEYFLSSKFWKYIFFNIITLNFVAPSLPNVLGEIAINGSLWTIKVEIAFYILLPLFFIMVNRFCKDKADRKKIANYGLVVFYVLSLVYSVVMPILCNKFNLPSSLKNQFPAYLSYFIAGMFFVINWDFINEHIKWVIIPAIIIIVLHFITKTAFLLPVALCILIMFLAFRMRIFNNIGKTIDYSYGMYLVHYPIILVLDEYKLFEYNFLLALIASVSMSFLFAYILEIIQKKIILYK